ncbi:MAG: LysM peptidoglycan-binding domain-containing protein [Cyanobacteria bacterium REEB67]|nr:LysM peptidoglycan-binding domain-containing protein [Cyanobacteria bacterium REEB67]
MVSELHKPAPTKDDTSARADAAEKHGGHADKADPSKLHADTHGSDALEQQRSARNQADHHTAPLPAVEVVDHSLKRDGSAQNYPVQKGDTLSDIARRQLPPGASVHEIYNQVKEIAKANHIPDANKIGEGQLLHLPAHVAHAHSDGRHAAAPQAGKDHPAVTPPSAKDQPAVTPPAAIDQPHLPAAKDQPAVSPPAAKDQPAVTPPVGKDQPQPPAAKDQPAAAPPAGKDQPAVAPPAAQDQTQPQAPHDQTPAVPAATAEQKAAAIQTSVDALQKALGDDNPTPPPAFGDGMMAYTGPITDSHKIMQVLGDKSPEEVKAIASAFDQAHGKEHGGRSLEEIIKDRLSGTERDKAVDLFHRKDKADDAGRVHTALEEMHEWGGRSRANCEKDIRDTLATMNSAQIADFKSDYQGRYGHSFDSDVNSDTKMSAETKAAIGIYSHGADHRSAKDTEDLADLAVKAKSLDMFQEAFRDASPEARKQFMASDGEAKMKGAFGGIFSDKDVEKAREYVNAGQLDTATKITDNVGVFSSNGAAIDNSINNMTQAERDQYARGKAAASTFQEYQTEAAGESVVTTFNTDGYNKLNPEQKADYDKYRAIHDGLQSAGDQAKVARWEDMIANKGETLVTKLAQHGGFTTDKVDKALSDIEGMNAQDFDHLKHNPEYRKQVDAALALNYSGDDLKRAEATLDRKLSHDTFEQSQSEQRSTEQQIADKTGFWSNDRAGMLAAVEHMSPAEQQRYREEPAFKKQLDEQIANGMSDSAEGLVAMRELDRIGKGLPPSEDIVSKMALHLNGSKETPAMLSEIETAFKQDPTLRERLKNPQTPEDKELARGFESLGRHNFGGDYDKYVAPLLKDGSIPFQTRAKLYDGWFSNDTKGLYESIAGASPEDKKALAADPKKMLPFLTDQQAALAGTIASQDGQIKPEDRMRAAVLGMSGDKDAIKEMGESLKPEERAQLIRDYETKYKSNLVSDLDDKLSGQDRTEAERNFRDLPDSARAAFNSARDEEYRSNDGIGRAFVRNAWDGTSDMSRDDLNKYAAAMSGYARDYKEMPVAQSEKMSTDLTQAVDLYRKSKGAAADAVVDGTVIVAGVGLAAVTGGVSLGLIATTTLGGAALKVGTKAAIMGDDYDSSKIGVDAVTGGVDAATMVLGPGEIAKVLQIGGKAGIAAGELTIAEAAAVAKAGGKQLLKEGVEAGLGNELKGTVTTALAHGAKEVDEKSIQAMAEKYAASPEDVTAVKEMLTKNLNQAVASESTSALRNTVREVALNSGAGAIGGGTSGAVRATSEWDSSQSVGENLTSIGEQTLMGATSGAVMGGGASLGFKAVGKGFAAAREAVGSHLRPSGAADLAEHLHVGDTVLPVGEHTVLDKSGRVAEIHGANRTDVTYHESGPMEGQVAKIDMHNGTKYESSADGKWRLTSPEHPQGAALDGEVKVKANGDIQVQHANGDIETHYPDGVRDLQQKESGNTISYGKDGKLLAVNTRSGQVAEYGYTPEGNFEGVQYKNGRSITSEDGGKTWNFKDGSDAVPRKIEGSVSKDEAGNIILKADGLRDQVYRPDGSSSYIDPVSGKPADITYPDGRVARLEYGKDGIVTRYTTPDGTTYHAEKLTDGRESQIYNIISADGTEKDWTPATFRVSRDGIVSGEIVGLSFSNDTDGRILNFDPLSGQPYREIVPDGYAREGLTPGADGRLLDQNGKKVDYTREKFGYSVSHNEAGALRQVEAELKDVKAIGADGKPTSAYDSLINDPTLNDAQKDNIVRNLAFVREHFAGYRVGDRMHPDPEVNWIHTQGEMAKVLEVGRAKKLSGEELQDSVLASMYSDSVKFAFPPPDGASANFFTHHLDGALAAQQQLLRQGLAPERVDRIVEAIKAHQIAPPELMGQLYHMSISGELSRKFRAGEIDTGEYERLRKTLKNMTQVGADQKPRLSFMADINNAPREIGADGHMQVVLSDDQRKLLSYAGIDKWSVPYDPKFDPNFRQMSKAEQAEALSRQKIAQTLIDGDAIDNYATTGGASKIVAIRGPGTGFRDARIFDSIKSIDQSYNDAYKVLSPEARKIADANLAGREGLTNYDGSKLKSDFEGWLRSKGKNPDQPIPYYNTDLVYPALGPLRPGDDPMLNMTAQQKADFDFAREMRAKMVDLLRRDHRTDDSLPGNFYASGRLDSRTNQPSSFAEFAPAKLDIAGVKPEDIHPGESFKSPDGKISAFRSAEDGSLQVSDFEQLAFRKYDGQNRLLETDGTVASRKFTYDPEGKVSEITTVDKNNGETTVLSRHGSADNIGWDTVRTAADGTVLSKDSIYNVNALVDADGTVRLGEKGSYRVERYNPDGSHDLLKPSGRIEYLEANYAHEKAFVHDNLTNALRDNPKRLARMENLLNEFEHQAGSPERDLSENQKALLYKQINRLLADTPGAVLPMADRVNLAEQVLDHSAHPWTVDQGNNNTCNVTTIEHRNYWRNPDKNAQLVADIAQTGHYRFSGGQEVDLRNIAGELRPDAEARDGMRRQALDVVPDGGTLKQDGSRDYASQLIETAMINQYWKSATEVIDASGRRLTSADYEMRFDSQGRPLGVANHEHVTALRDANGDIPPSYEAGVQYFDENKQPIAKLTPDRILYDKEGRATAVIDKPASLQKVYDGNGKLLDEVQPNAYGQRFYDADGKAIIAKTRPGDLHYEKIPVGPTKEGERVFVAINGKQIELKNSRGEVVTSPGLGSDKLREIGNEVANTQDSSYVIARNHKAGYSELSVDSPEQFVQKLKELKASKNLPAVLLVNSSKPPFNHAPTFNSEGVFDGWHVVNVQDISESIDPKTGAKTEMVHFTNQWGSAADHLEKGMSAQIMFDAMGDTPKREKPLRLLKQKDGADGKSRGFLGWIKSWF